MLLKRNRAQFGPATLLQKRRAVLNRVMALVGIPHRGRREPSSHWMSRAARLVVLERRLPDPLGRSIDARTGVDVVVPVGPRDIGVLELMLEGVHRNLAGPVGEIWCVAPSDVGAELRRRYRDVSVIDEEDVIGHERKARVGPMFGVRAGWMLQQFITLSTPEITCAEAVVVIDADTILLRPRRFRVGQTTLLLAAQEFHIEYYEVLARVWGRSLELPPFSCIAHHMCCLRDDVLAMRGAIEQRWDAHWIDVLVSCCDPERGEFLSEYELYGQWRLRTAPDATVVRPIRNVARTRASGDTLDGLVRVLPSWAYSVSCHWYL